MPLTGKYTSAKSEVDGNILGTIAAAEDPTIFIPVGVMMSSENSLLSGVATRAGVAAANTQEDLTTLTPLISISNNPSLVLYGHFHYSNHQAGVYLIFYDSADNVMFTTGPYTLSSSTWYDGLNYPSNRYLIDTCGASKVYGYISSLTDGGVIDLYLGLISG